MRVTLGSQMDYAKANMSASYARLVRLQELVASGKKVSRPSHDPVAANQSLYYTQQLADIEQYLRNAGIAKDFMARTSAALDEVYSQIQSAIGDARSSINATMSRAAREGLAAKLDALLERLRDVADTRHLGRYIFSGHRTDSPPVALEHRFTGTGAFVPQATGGTLTINGVAIAVEPGDTAAALIARINQRSGLHRVTARDNGAGGVELRMAHPDGGNVIQVAVSGGYTLDQIFGTAPVETVGTGFTYGGGDGSVRIQVSPSTVVSASTTAAIVFNLDSAAAPGEPDLFRVIQDLKRAILDADVPATELGITRLEAASKRVLAMRVEFGGRIQNLEGMVGHLEQTRDNLKELRSRTEDADVAQAVVDLKTQEQVYQAALFSASSVFRLTLLDYLR
jgi:flagellar hook-associated protein 3 FlgL